MPYFRSDEDDEFINNLRDVISMRDKTIEQLEQSIKNHIESAEGYEERIEQLEG